MSKIRVAIAGVGNCASALIQGVEYYRDIPIENDVPGIMHATFGEYHIKDIQFVAAFDVNRDKIGKDLSAAIFAGSNNCAKISDVPYLGVQVSPAPTLDGVPKHMTESFQPYQDEEVGLEDIVSILKESEADMLVNYLPVGSRKATRFYAQAALKADCAFINCIPEFIASNPKWNKKFERKGLPVAGDDIKSQLGATILHRKMVELCMNRGVKVDETYQLNLGGNTDFLNMTVEDRLKSKRVSKTEAVTSLIPYHVPTRIGPTDYVQFLGDKKICHILINGRKFGDQPVSIRARLEVEDSPNSAGVVVDVIRAVKMALNRKIAGSLTSISSYAFKHPPNQVPDSTAKLWVEEYIRGKRRR
ncbi:MAG: inositol-3-phosphate synthase [Thermoproteota archaeon]